MKTLAFFIVTAFITTPALGAAAGVAPQTTPGASQIYKGRVHNEEKVAATSIELEVPSGITVAAVAPIPGGNITTEKTGDRISRVTWHTEIASNKYVELAFTATNPSKAMQVQWVVHERMADGTVVNWSDAPGAEGKASTTKIVTSAPPPIAAPAK